MEKVIYQHRFGLGFILEDENALSQHVAPIETVLGELRLQVGDETDVNGLLIQSMTYCGALRAELAEGKQTAVFFIGADGDLFHTRYYYAYYHVLHENRVCNVFARGTARDYNWIGKQWK